MHIVTRKTENHVRFVDVEQRDDAAVAMTWCLQETRLQSRLGFAVNSAQQALKCAVVLTELLQAGVPLYAHVVQQRNARSWCMVCIIL
jgi:hypothetical protein